MTALSAMMAAWATKAVWAALGLGVAWLVDEAGMGWRG
jgi:hypothetical protein